MLLTWNAWKPFLKNYTIPFVQLDPIKTILCFSHDQNTFDKAKLLDNKHPKYVKWSGKTKKVMGKEMKKTRISWGQAYKDSQKND